MEAALRVLLPRNTSRSFQAFRDALREMVPRAG